MIAMAQMITVKISDLPEIIYQSDDVFFTNSGRAVVAWSFDGDDAYQLAVMIPAKGMTALDCAKKMI
jgi:hypothetical protein